MPELLIDEMIQLDDPFLADMPNMLLKAEEENGQWVVYLKASDETRDQDGEVMESAALQKARDYFLTHGVLSWDHQHKLTRDPKYIIGEPLEVKFTSNRETLAKGFLYQQNEIAKAVWNNIRSNAKRLGASVGGGILRKSGPNKENISEVVWDEIALTHKPVHAGTYGQVRLVPFKSFVKALTAGSGVNAMLFTGGRALIGESMQGAGAAAAAAYSGLPVGFPTKDELMDVFQTVMKSVLSGKITDYADLRQHIQGRGYPDGVADRIVRFIVLKMPAMVQHLESTR